MKIKSAVIFVFFLSIFSLKAGTASGPEFVEIELGSASQQPKLKKMENTLSQVSSPGNYTALIAVTYGREESPFLLKKFGHASLIIKGPDETYTKCHLRQGKSPVIEDIEDDIADAKRILEDLKKQPKTNVQKKIRDEQISGLEKVKSQIISKNKEAIKDKLRAYRKNEDSLDLLGVEEYEEIESLTLTPVKYDLMIKNIESVERILNDDPDDQPNEEDKIRISDVKKLNCLSFIEYVIPDKAFKMESSSGIPFFEQSFQEYKKTPKKERSRLKHYSRKTADCCLCCGSCC